MKLIEMFTLIQDEKMSEEYLRQKGILNIFAECINCGSDKIGIIRGDRYRCYKCKKEWSRRRGSILAVTRMEYSEFIICLKLFELEFNAEKAARELVINYKTIHTLFMYFRNAISGLTESELNNFEGLIKKGIKSICIGYSKDKVKFELINKSNCNSHININRHRTQDGAAYYEVEYERLKNILSVGKSVGYFDELDRFWRFARERLFSYRGTEQKYFILYLKEIEFRYNNKNKDMFEEIISKLKDYVGGYL